MGSPVRADTLRTYHGNSSITRCTSSTSGRTPSTAWTMPMGKKSVSPLATSTAPGGAERSIHLAQLHHRLGKEAQLLQPPLGPQRVRAVLRRMMPAIQ